MKKVRITIELSPVTFANGRSYLSSECQAICDNWDSPVEMQEQALFQDSVFIAIPSQESETTLTERVARRYPGGSIEVVESCDFGSINL